VSWRGHDARYNLTAPDGATGFRFVSPPTDDPQIKERERFQWTDAAGKVVSRARWRSQSGGAYNGPGIEFSISKETRLKLSNVNLRQRGTTPVFNGKNLDGWTVFKGDPKRANSKFDVTPAGELRVTNGPGDLQTTKAFDDFVLQFECKTNGKALNSGVFF